MTITLCNNNHLKIGKDFVDAVIGKPKARGTVRINGKDYTFQSALVVDGLGLCEVAERALRSAAKRENVSFDAITVQAV